MGVAIPEDEAAGGGIQDRCSWLSGGRVQRCGKSIIGAHFSDFGKFWTPRWRYCTRPTRSAQSMLAGDEPIDLAVSDDVPVLVPEQQVVIASLGIDPVCR
jgi:hypothetical protein